MVPIIRFSGEFGRMIPLAVPNLSGREADYLLDCIRTNFVSSVGPYVDRFEQMVADASGGEKAVATNTGTSGLHVAMLALGVLPNDLVVIPSFTFIASANAASYCGASPWLIDCSNDSWTLDPELLSAELASNTEQTPHGLRHRPTGRRVSAICPVFVMGCPADMDRIVDIARQYRLKVVVDAAAAFGASYKTRSTASLGADLTVFSFNGNKTITCGGGGAVVGDSTEHIAHVRHLCTTARRDENYTHDAIGYNYRMTNLQAAVGCAQLERADELVSAKQAISNTYNDAFSNLPFTYPFPSPSWASSSCWFSGFVLSKNAPFSAKELRILLRSRGIDARPFWKPLHLQHSYQHVPQTAMPICSSLFCQIITLPCSSNLKANEQDLVIDEIYKIFSDRISLS